VDLAQDSAQAEQLLLEALGVKLRTSFNVAALSSAPRFNASLILEPFSPRDLARQLAIELPEMADSKALNNASMSATIAGDLNQISVNDLLLQLDDTELRGQLALKDFAAPAITYQLEISQIDVDRYLPPPSETPAEPVVASPATALAAEAALIPVEPLRELNLDGTLRVMRLSAMNLKAHDIRVTTRAANGRIRLHPIGAQLYDGNYSGDIQLDATGEVLRIRLNESLNGVQIGPLLQDFMGNDIIQGRANLSAQLETRGADPQAMIAALNGTAGFDFKDGAVKGFNLAQYERELSARLRGEPVPKDDTPLATDFAHLYGSVTLTNGVARNNDLTANLPFARVRGEGEANLVNETVDYTARVRFTSRAEGQGSVTYEELTDRVALPIRIQGALAEPAITVDYNYVLRELAARELRKQQEALQQKADERIQQEQQKLDQRVEQEKQKLKDELEQKAGERLRRLLR
jgi:AsmA protein